MESYLSVAWTKRGSFFEGLCRIFHLLTQEASHPKEMPGVCVTRICRGESLQAAARPAEFESAQVQTCGVQITSPREPACGRPAFVILVQRQRGKRKAGDHPAERIDERIARPSRDLLDQLRVVLRVRRDAELQMGSVGRSAQQATDPLFHSGKNAAGLRLGTRPEGIVLRYVIGE